MRSRARHAAFPLAGALCVGALVVVMAAVGAARSHAAVASPGAIAGIVDIDTNLKYQGEMAAGTGMVLTSFAANPQTALSNDVAQAVTVAPNGTIYVAGSSDATGNGRSTTRDPAIRGVGTDDQVGPGDGDPLWRRSPDARAFPFTIMIGIVPLIDESNA